MHSDQQWWRDAVTYQVYLRSFRDGDGDGIGDIAGIRERLPYLAELGVDALWINPWYPSPMADAGYDVSDYRDIEPLFGTLDEARALIDEAHELGLRVVLDIVPNHSSDQHAWFQAAVAAAPGSPERARYMFRKGRGDDQSEPPNDWLSVFGGPAWEQLPAAADGTPGEWYLHIFAPEQPDFDWTNPEVRAEFESILRFWFDIGVDGFRIDVAHGLVKDPALPDLGEQHEGILQHADGRNHPHWDLDGVHEIYRGWRAVADDYDPPRAFVAEAWVDSAERLVRYLRPDELHTAFNFEYLSAPWRAAQIREVVDSTLATSTLAGAPATWVLSNHDVVRHVSRYAREQGTEPAHALASFVGKPADLELGTRRARAAALLMLALPGGAYIYQGEELGLWEVEDLPVDLLEDPVWERSGRTDRGRDGCRVPLPWVADSPGLGFAGEPDASATPWLPQPGGWRALAADVQAGDFGSMLELYRAALRHRRELFTGNGEFAWLDSPTEIIAFTRGDAACLVNFDGTPTALPPGFELVLASEALTADAQLPTDAAAWLVRSS
ncbi:MAG: aglA [Thermoleophilia bacterium]|nr:aglA [Thermoleophilia bacterium]